VTKKLDSSQNYNIARDIIMAVEYKKEGKIAVITFNRPEAMNAINSQTHQELSQALGDFLDNPELWVAILTGAGDKAFSAGMDLKSTSFATRDSQTRTTDRNVLTWKRNIWKPLIAAINGYCLGAGLEIAMLCDLRIAAEHARFGMPEVLRGLIPASGGIQRLVRLVVRGHAAEMILTGKYIDTQEAYRMGLVNQVVPLDKLLPTAMEWAETICQAAPLAVRAAKEAMLRGIDVPFADGLALERKLADYTHTTEDFVEGRKAFIEKRKPDYKGR